MYMAFDYVLMNLPCSMLYSSFSLWVYGCSYGCLFVLIPVCSWSSFNCMQLIDVGLVQCWLICSFFISSTVLEHYFATWPDLYIAFIVQGICHQEDLSSRKVCFIFMCMGNMFVDVYVTAALESSIWNHNCAYFRCVIYNNFNPNFTAYLYLHRDLIFIWRWGSFLVILCLLKTINQSWKVQPSNTKTIKLVLSYSASNPI